MSLLQLQLRAKRFAGQARAVLSELQLQLQPGEVVALLGASGCGKSTLLRVLAGLDTDFEGQVLLQGQVLSGPRHEIGMVFQEPRLFPWLDVARNVALDLGQGMDRTRVGALLAEVGLGGLAQALPKQLSGGQAQRVAIARALYTQPRLLLLDEPFSALDAITRARLQELVLALARAHGTGLLLVTHDVEEAVLMADRILVLAPDPGRVVLERTVDLPHPRQRHGAELARWRTELVGHLHAQNA